MAGWVELWIDEMGSSKSNNHPFIQPSSHPTFVPSNQPIEMTGWPKGLLVRGGGDMR